MNNKVVKVLIPVLILVAVVGIWFVKNKPTETKEMAKTEKSENKEEQKKNSSSDMKDEKAADAKKMSSSVKEGEPNFTFEFSEALDFDELKKHGLPILVDFGSATCGPCIQMHPALEAIHQAYEGKAFIKYADVWANPDTTQNIPVRVTPTQVLFTAEGKPYVPSQEMIDKFGPASFTTYNDRSEKHVLTVHEGTLNEEDMKMLLKDMGVKE